MFIEWKQRTSQKGYYLKVGKKKRGTPNKKWFNEVKLVIQTLNHSINHF